MHTRPIGTLNASVIGLGCNNFGWRIDAKKTEEVVLASLDAGINFFDTSDSYGPETSEEFLGAALGARRGEAIVATKFGTKLDDARGGARPEYVKRALEDSLRRLGTDYIDLYQLHRPDPETPIADTLGALNDLVAEGKVREIGCSNFSLDQLREAGSAVPQGKARFVSVQNQYSLLHRHPELDVLPECQRTNVAFLPYFPLASGLLTGKYHKGKPAPKGTRIGDDFLNRFGSEENWTRVEQLRAFAKSREHSLLELAFSWLLNHQAVASVIAGATSAGQVYANAKAATWTLTTEEMAEIDTIIPPPQ